ncbi:RdgB/HAM1 family non-canonical purine NTP pyrophosphatase [Candidatus Fermentibacteria bacterium]|nr:RdgB/HAM1 family non-canonical purine NTP pyrophosphatase [Candidatus Fermentibacteria bacterium]
MFILATSNPDKASEMLDILGSVGIEASCPSPGDLPQVEETGATIEENALIKARACCARLGRPCIAEDTGLFVRALGGGPGVYASRFAGPGCTYDENVRKLISVIRGETGESRRAVFAAAAALCTPSGVEICASGELEGEIAEEPRGSGGFGYDPVFMVLGTGLTLAELDRERKNSLSHRNAALRALASKISERGGLPLQPQSPSSPVNS